MGVSVNRFMSLGLDRVAAVLLSLSFLGATLSCSHQEKKKNVEGTSEADQKNSSDPYGYLMDVQGAKSLDWVNAANKRTLEVLEKDPNFKKFEKEGVAILESKDRIPLGRLQGKYVYNLWQDSKNVRGLWRRTPVAEYGKKATKWDVILDLDELAKKENENWVFKGSHCLEPNYELCLLDLSRGGKDAVVVREFNVNKKMFVANGFNLPEAKTDSMWIDKDQILVATDFGPGSMTDSGYARTVRLLKRGQSLAESVEIFAGKKEDMATGSFKLDSKKGSTFYISRKPSFRTSEVYQLNPQTKNLTRLNLPEDAEILGNLEDNILLSLRSDLKTKAKVFKKGSLLSSRDLTVKEPEYQLVFEPDSHSSLGDVSVALNKVYFIVLKDVASQVYQAKLQGQTWTLSKIISPEKQTTSIMTSSFESPDVFFISEGFLNPSTLYKIDKAGNKLVKQMALPSKFKHLGLVVEQKFATAPDGVMVPYFIVRKSNVRSITPTLLYGYGGFEISETPAYWATVGKLWLERGGTFVVANIRGGGEYGPSWHQAALREKRQTAFDDFSSVAKDLIAQGLTDSKHLGIMGGSNGGLLVGTSFVQNPSLYEAVVCSVPLLDMLTYHKFLAGASWMEEYGNPEKPEDAKFIAKYSPYQNVKPGVKYPEVFFMTSTLDDRVHPGHARKMAAKMKDQGHPFYYFENTEGGHAASSNLRQRARRSALEFTYLWKKLGTPL